MNGMVDSQGRAMLAIPIRSGPDGHDSLVDVWIDTGFTGDLVLPKSQIERLELHPSAVIQTTMADGRQTALESFVAWIDWFGELQEVEVCASSGQNILLGVRLMLGRRLVIDYGTMDLALE